MGNEAVSRMRRSNRYYGITPYRYLGYDKMAMFVGYELAMYWLWTLAVERGYVISRSIYWLDFCPDS